jgi:hypothetical protein
LLELGYLTRDYFSQEQHKCYYYQIGPTFEADLQQEDQRRIFEQSILRVTDGKLASSVKHYPYDKNGRKISQLNQDALATLKTNIIDIDRLETALKNMRWDAERVKHYRKRRRLELQSHSAQRFMSRIMRQKHWKVWGCPTWNIEYCVAYTGSTTGRLFERGGAMQSMPRRLKKAAYEWLLVNNYDMRSCHPSIIAQICREEGIVLEHTEAYVQNPRAKYNRAATAGIPVDVWKACFIAIYYGAQIGKHHESQIYRNIWEFLEEEQVEYDAEDIGIYYDRFVNAAWHYIAEAQRWFKLLKDKLIHRYSVVHKGETWLKNACGSLQPLAEFNNTREIAMFVCQGYESAFINHLVLLGKEYGYTPRALEHDGLLVEGDIPQAAILKARALSGFHTAILEKKDF